MDRMAAVHAARNNQAFELSEVTSSEEIDEFFQDLQKIQVESLQIAYSMGGATLKIAETSWDNATYSSGTNREGTTIALSLAF